jgi:alpha(1,3/1,4) fucosyltransferase
MQPVPASRPRLSVSFHNFWPDFDPKGSFFAKALSTKYDLVIEACGRDVQFSSVMHMELMPSKPGSRPLRVWYSGENREPQHEIYDLHFGFRPSSILGKRWFRYPLWIAYIDWWDPSSPHHVSRLLERRAARPARERSRFCNFIYSNPTSLRSEFFLRLNELRHVDSCGRVLNNCGWRPDGLAGKMSVLTDSVFTIAFENVAAPGYVTEKIVEPLLAGSVPIYWGAAEAKSDFNPQAFLFAEDFGSLDELAQHVLSLADNSDRLEEIRSAPPFIGNHIAYEHTPEFFVDRISEALSGNLAATIPAAWQQPLVPTKKGKTLMRRWRRMTGDVRRRIKALLR